MIDLTPLQQVPHRSPWLSMFTWSVDLDEIRRNRGGDVADAKDDVAQTPSVQASLDADAWVPIAEVFNRLADGATLEQILQAFPAISRRAACDALREAALRFPFHASFHRAIDCWTPRYPYER